ncbi:hypothetical protein Tco_0872272 [Tanacetum coccineum]
MKLDERLASLDIDLDMELFPYTLTVVASRLGKAISLEIEKGIQSGLEARIKHGKAGRDLKDIRAYDVEAEAKYLVVRDLKDIHFPLLEDLKALKYSSIELLMASLTLEGSHGKEDESIEFCHLQPVKEQLTVPIYYERGGSCVPNLWDREILLRDDLAAFRTRGEKKKKKDAFLDLALMVDASMVTTTLIPAIDPSKVVSDAARDGSTLTVVVSQGPSIVAMDYQISDLNVDGVEIQNDDDDMFDSSLLDKPEDHQTSAPK